MTLVDAHCHLDSEALRPNLDAVLAEARRIGVARFVTAGVSPEQWDATQAVAKAHEGVAFALGIHPLFVRPEHRDDLSALSTARSRGAVAIGEIGLDKKGDSPDWTLQRDLFEAQLGVARTLDLPVVIHCRGAYAELLGSVKAVGLSPRGGMVHAFSGTVDDAEACIGLGLRVSLGGTLTYRNSSKRAAVLRLAYPDHLVLETDSPDMPPVQRRGAPNVPANILLNLQAAAETLDEPPERIAEATTRNALCLFGLEL